jgi:hypothetical protein
MAPHQSGRRSGWPRSRTCSARARSAPTASSWGRAAPRNVRPRNVDSSPPPHASRCDRARPPRHARPELGRHHHTVQVEPVCKERSQGPDRRVSQRTGLATRVHKHWKTRWFSRRRVARSSTVNGRRRVGWVSPARTRGAAGPSRDSPSNRPHEAVDVFAVGGRRPRGRCVRGGVAVDANPLMVDDLADTFVVDAFAVAVGANPVAVDDSQTRLRSLRSRAVAGVVGRSVRLALKPRTSRAASRPCAAPDRRAG